MTSPSLTVGNVQVQYNNLKQNCTFNGVVVVNDETKRLAQSWKHQLLRSEHKDVTQCNFESVHL